LNYLIYLAQKMIPAVPENCPTFSRASRLENLPHLPSDLHELLIFVVTIQYTVWKAIEK
jgi:hypothetical protein